MKFSRKEIVGAVSVFGAVILTGVIHVGILEWYQADIRYEEGSYYISADKAVASLKIENVGHADAENLIVTARFGSSILYVSTDVPSPKLEIVAGGVGERFLTSRFDRLVPGQRLSVFYEIKYPGSNDELRRDFADEITFNGGTGKKGEPILSAENFASVGLGLLTVLLGMVALTLVSYWALNVSNNETGQDE